MPYIECLAVCLPELDLVNPLIAFLLLTFVLTWTAWLAPGILVPRHEVFGVGGPVFLLGVFAPGLAALALTAHAEGRKGVLDLVGRIGRGQVSWRLYLFALGYVGAVKLLAASIHRFVAGAWPAFGETPFMVMLVAILISTWVQAGEELGWRGYLLPRLAIRVGLSGASLVLGVIWAFWHLPLFFLRDSGSDGQSFPIYLLYVTALSVAMAWLYWKAGGSLLIVMVMHASANNTIGIVPGALPHAVHSMSFEGSLVAWTTIGILWSIAVALLYRMRRAEVRAI
jgi:membrane protease YdiL (CAAX protease family)